LLEYSREELVGKELWEIGLFDDRGQSQVAFQELQEKGRIRYEDLPLQSKYGERREVEFISKVYRENGHRVVICVIRDIVDRKRIQKDKYFLAAIVESLEDSVVTVDFDTIITSWNKAAERLYGYRAEDVIGQPLTILTLPEDLKDLLAKIKQVRSGEDVLVYETERLHKGGRRLFLLITLSPVKDAHGRVIGVSTVARDISERKRAYEALRESLEREQAARAEAERANRLKDEFLATLSHELRNPLNTIVGYAEVLLRAPDAKHVPLIQEAAKAIRRNATAQAQLVNDLLDLSRLQTSKLAVERRPISLGPIVADAVTSIRAQAEGKGIKLTSDYPADPLAVNADPVRVQQIVWNLVNNAVKFTPRDGRVSVCLSREADKAKLEVEDTGQGIDPEFLPYVFEMFRQADTQTTRTHGGMGIGLALVKQLVDLHGGQIQAHSEGAGRGSRFTVWFELSTTAPERSTTITKSSEGELLGARILVVDDNRDTLDMLQVLLEGEGAVVETALSGADALRKAETSQMDLVISDIAMPGMDGYELLKELRGQSRYANVPAIAITGFGREEDVERARQAGFTTHLTKPLNFRHLLRLACVALRR
jgi:two-component system CheB/CheR fusion protein